MNLLNLCVEQISDGRQVFRDGICFSNVLLVGMFIDGQNIEEREVFRDSLVYFDELERSVESSGNYLIFTCACGVAEDGGWEGVKVEVTESTVSWELEAGAEVLRFTFERKAYVSEIESVRKVLQSSSLPLEPGAVVFPEDFKR
jgi:hypothetical protein